MIKHILLVAVLDEMEQQETKLETLFEKRPEDWEEIYTASRRQVRLCIAELVKLAQDELDMSESDALHLRDVFESFRDQTARHQDYWSIERIDLSDPRCVEAFRALRKASAEFKSVMFGLIDRYRVSEHIT